MPRSSDLLCIRLPAPSHMALLEPTGQPRPYLAVSPFTLLQALVLLELPERDETEAGGRCRLPGLSQLLVQKQVSERGKREPRSYVRDLRPHLLGNVAPKQMQPKPEKHPTGPFHSTWRLIG